jgi:hypothetical protein
LFPSHPLVNGALALRTPTVVFRRSVIFHRSTCGSRILEWATKARAGRTYSIGAG